MEGVDYLIERMRLVSFVLVAFFLLAVTVHAIFWPPKPPPQSWADGIYYNACCAPVTLRRGVISAENHSSPYRVESGKRGYYIDIPAGISVQEGHVVFGGTLAFVQFNKVSELEPAVHEARSLHIYGWDDSIDYVFEKR